MEEFKKPCLPNASLKAETAELIAKKTKENVKSSDENSDVANDEKVAQLCPYKVPVWSDRPSDTNNYSFEVLKSGQIINEIKELQKKPYWSFGRLPENDVELAHPTISRFHAILQYRPKFKKSDNLNDEKKESEDYSHKDESPPEGWYIYDLCSTHGTFLNKQRIPAKVYIRIRVGHMLRLGASTRSYILQGPSEDEEPESEMTITELKAKRQQELEEIALQKTRLSEEAVERAKNEGCSWGMGEDADEETDLKHNPYASTNNEGFFLDDPKKTLRGYFEREGIELVYKCDEMSAGSFVCRVELPIDDTNGRPIVSEVVHKGKKKDCVLQCALEACRILDRHGVLRQANQEPLKRKQKSKGSDSDDDEFWDRTGDVARKKQRKANVNTSVTLTYEDLLKQESDVDEQIKQIEFKINKYLEQQKNIKAQKIEDGEDLDAFMENLPEKETKLDKIEIRKLRLEEQRLKNEKVRIQRLTKIAKPIDLVFSTITDGSIKSKTQEQGQTSLKKQLPMIGKRNQFSKFKIVKANTTSTSKESKTVKLLDSDEEEIEEDESPIEKKCEEELCKDITSTNDCKETKEENIKIVEQLENNQCLRESGKSKDNDAIAEHSNSEKEDSSSKNVQDLPENAEDKGTDVASCSKKRRHRIRLRGKRQEVDIGDDANYESPDKYAKWVPPDNQTGDGFTELNKKFGY